ncbi:MAG: alpha 1,2 mannosyltransferase [Chrysothrix sp. TS-e1954]|nr:MAG: alpha 1,2 mannosyltransferase [Chrysothrix sp. TS-e1954]
MWRRLYLLLALVRLFFALSPSYLHPDEHFQGPEVIAGRIFGYPVHHTWEFHSTSPIRSAFSLWPTYGLPMLIARWLWEGSGNGPIRPIIVYWTLRVLMFTLSLVLEDWAIQELVEAPHRRPEALLLVSSSYVTWTWQGHTFSSSVETLTVLWSLALIKRIVDRKERRTGFASPITLGIVLVFGTFNRITFPAFLLAPGLQLLPILLKRRPTLFVLCTTCAATTCLAILVDTTFHTAGHLSLDELWQRPVVTPLNNLLFNVQPSNLHQFGQHPFYQHFIINLPQLLGPAFILLFRSAALTTTTISALTGTVILSIMPHQEARFLLPVIPLVLLSVRVPRQFSRLWLTSWLAFNCVLGLLMGIYHQGGVVPAQSFLQTQENVSYAYWWKSYSPPTWLSGDRNRDMTTVDLMGLEPQSLAHRICERASPTNGVLVAPNSAVFLDQFVEHSSETSRALTLYKIWDHRAHLNLDDLDFGEDGLLPTVRRVLGRRGLSIWTIQCRSMPAEDG